MKATATWVLLMACALAQPSVADEPASTASPDRYGFIPIGTIITDPAVGFGGGLGLVFLQPGVTPAGELPRPNMTGAAGFATDNGTWGAGAADSREWRGGQLRTLAAALTLSANLELFASEDGDDGRDYHLETWGLLTETNWKVRDSHALVGLRYTYADVTTTFEAGELLPDRETSGRSQQLSALTPMLTFDSRDNIFTPTRGGYAQISVSLFSPVLGGDEDFQLVSLTGMWFRPVSERLTVGMKGDFVASSGQTPFYLRPFVQLRGIQSLRLQDDEMAQAEVEVRWQRWSRVSLVAFAGAGVVWRGMEDVQRPRDVVTGGGGFRYLVARRFGLHMGLDVGFGPDDPIVYFQFGSAWFRP